MMQTQQIMPAMPHCHRVRRILQAKVVEAYFEGNSRTTRETTLNLPPKMATESDKIGTWNLGFGSNMNVKNVTEKKLVPVLGKY